MVVGNNVYVCMFCISITVHLNINIYTFTSEGKSVMLYLKRKDDEIWSVFKVVV